MEVIGGEGVRLPTYRRAWKNLKQRKKDVASLLISMKEVKEVK